MRKSLMIALVASVAVGASPSAFAFKEFYDQWVEMYIDDSNTSKEATEFSNLATDPKTRCLVCHQGKSKKNHNPYGDHFVGVIDKTHRKDVDKIKQVLKDVADKKSDPSDANSKTYAELIKEFKLPGGELAELQKEPAK